MNNHRTSILCLILSLAAILFSGCGPSRPPLGKVEGTVLCNGDPIKVGAIVFAVAGTRDASGLIENGIIKDVTTFSKGDGVPVGEARIAVIVLEDPPPPVSTPRIVTDPTKPSADTPMIGGRKFAIPVKYVNPETSGLTVMIKKGSNTIDLELTK